MHHDASLCVRCSCSWSCETRMCIRRLLPCAMGSGDGFASLSYNRSVIADCRCNCHQMPISHTASIGGPHDSTSFLHSDVKYKLEMVIPNETHARLKLETAGNGNAHARYGGSEPLPSADQTTQQQIQCGATYMVVRDHELGSSLERHHTADRWS